MGKHLGGHWHGGDNVIRDLGRVFLGWIPQTKVGVRKARARGKDGKSVGACNLAFTSQAPARLRRVSNGEVCKRFRPCRWHTPVMVTLQEGDMSKGRGGEDESVGGTGV